MEVGERGFERARVLEASGLICYDQINMRGMVRFLEHIGLSNKFLIYVFGRNFS